MGLEKVLSIAKVVRVSYCDCEDDPEPEVKYFLPSGYQNRCIEVYESAYEELEVRLVSKAVMDNLLKEMELKKRGKPLGSLS